MGIIIFTIKILFYLILYYIPHSCGILTIQITTLLFLSFSTFPPVYYIIKTGYNDTLSFLLITLSYVSCGNNLQCMFSLNDIQYNSVAVVCLWNVSTVEIKYLYKSKKQQIKDKLCRTSNAKLNCLWFMRNSV